MVNYKHFILLLAIASVSTLPWLGLTDFNTKGEPREAIVGLTMLEQGNWTLPTNNGGEMAYKPPMFHWMVAAASLARGEVNEWTARLPSALAGVCLTLWTYVFFARRRDSGTALLAALMLLTSFEVWRAATTCRVDMVLTLCICGAMLALAAWRDGGGWRHYLLGVLMMSAGTLTKGPVAIVLPCGVTGIYMLLRRDSLWKTLGWMALAAVCAVALPMLWYIAAWRQGGEAFLALVREENVDRFLGKMAYHSHENGLWYYFALLPAGLLPWTLPVAWMWWRKRHDTPHIKTWLKLSPETLYSVIALIVIFVFYCIPKSKRSVYLLPVYPFACWLCAIALRTWSVRARRLALGSVVALWVLAFAVVLPNVLNKRSDKDIAEDLRQMNLKSHPLLSYIADSDPGDPMHFFTINFYLHDGVGVWDEQKSEEGCFLLIGENDARQFMHTHDGIAFMLMYTSKHKSCDTKQKVQLYQLVPVRSCSK